MTFEDFARHLAALEGFELSGVQRDYCRAVDQHRSRVLLVGAGRRLGLRWLAQAFEQYRFHETLARIADEVDRVEWAQSHWNCARQGHIFEMASDKCVACKTPADPPERIELEQEAP